MSIYRMIRVGLSQRDRVAVLVENAGVRRLACEVQAVAVRAGK